MRITAQVTFRNIICYIRYVFLHINIVIIGSPSKKMKRLHDLYRSPSDIAFKGSFDQVMFIANTVIDIIMYLDSI